MIEMLKDKYQIIRRIGSGGMAQIYLAKDLLTHKNVAIKILSPDRKDDYYSKKRFLSEIELTKKIDSPYVVKIFSTEWNDDIQYISMEYIEGSILKDYIDRKTRLTVDETVEFAKQLALGFDEIHKKGIIHRDIKSLNVMIASHGQIKIIDFGIALTQSSERLTHTGNLIASPQYIAPELVKQTTQPNYQTDIYAFGILLYEMLAGQVPFKEKSIIDTALKHTTTDVPRINKLFPNIPNSLANIITKATFRDSNYRYKNMYDIYQDLNTCLLREKINEPDYNPLNKKSLSVEKTINSKLFLIGIIALSIFLLIALIVILVLVI